MENKNGLSFYFSVVGFRPSIHSCLCAILLSEVSARLFDKIYSINNMILLLLLLSRFSCVRLCTDPTDGSPPGSVVPGILQARTLEWVAISFSSAWKWKVKVKSLSCVHSSRPHGLQPTRLLGPWDFPGKSTSGHWFPFSQQTSVCLHG